MSLAITPVGTAKPPVAEAPKIYAETFRHSIVDSTWQPERSLLSEVDGSPRLCQYYRQFLQDGEEPRPFAPGGVGTYQSYTTITRLPIKIEGNGSFNFNPETGESDMTYGGWLLFDVAPIRHDVMIMDIGDGHAGILAITEQPEIKNETANKVYYIQFKLLGFLRKIDNDILVGKTVQSRVYSKDSALHGGHSLITTNEEQVGKELFQWNLTISNFIMREFYWNPERTIVFPYGTGETTQMVYDPYLVNFLCAVLHPEARTLYPPISTFSVQYGGLEKGRYGTINIWEVLLRCDMNLLQICTNKAARMETSRLQNTRLYGNLRSSKIKWFITTNPEDFKQYKVYYNTDGYPILQPGNEEKITYLFSEGFYTGNPEGEFENLVYSSYRDQLIDHARLLAYCKTYFTLTPKEQLYHGAILLRLLGFARRIGGPL